MSRQLRPRKSRPSYAALAGLDGDNAVAGPSNQVFDESGDSGSDFAPEKGEKRGIGDDEDAIGEEVAEDEFVPEESVSSKPSKRAPRGASKGKGKAKKATTSAILAPAASLPRTSRRQMHMLPTPSVHHRHRATPLFSRAGFVERLISPPSLFGPINVTATNAFTHNTQITDRVNKAWGYNVGPGPLWQLTEDRRWFKEAITTGKDVDCERNRRPRVYPDVPVKNGWKVINKSEAAVYLPTANETMEDGTFKPPPPISCYFGPINSQTKRDMNMLDSLAMSEYLPESQACVFNAVKLPNPLLRIELDETSCWSFDWANSERVAIGTTNGIIAVYDFGRAIRSIVNPDTDTIINLRPSHYLAIHQSAIRALAWIQAPPYSASGEPSLDDDPTVIASGGYDGVECLLDIREGRGAIMNRTRDVINALTFSPFAAGPITMDHENTVKAYAASPSMLGRGHTLLEPLGPVWCVHASEYHPQLAVAAADGTCSTSNMLRSPRRGGSVVSQV
ncbi:hypothetical protein EST38_g9226 [Candolleomyces aberdarensis]|uniref:Uncharacterized protein n=1 Tax=Candolleomyces aberdarensis TaxID=2316362 RepID=A0A4Q2DAI6_9AGAR|nr:hypothetical protein EST38_g9226 [Candolleomyces aberdarensis]